LKLQFFLQLRQRLAAWLFSADRPNLGEGAFDLLQKKWMELEEISSGIASS
jgi:hypothetical protein